MSKEAMKLAQELRALADRFSEGWYEGIKIDASDIVLLSDAAEALAEQPAQGCEFCSHPLYAGTKCKNCGREQPAQQEPVAWPCLIAEADFSEDTVTLAMQCTDYKVSAGKHWLSNTPPAQQCWKCGDMDAAFQAKCNVPACGMKEQP